MFSDILSYLFGDPSLRSLDYYMRWREDLIWVHAISDALIALSYFAIPLAIFWFLQKRPDIQGMTRYVGYLLITFIFVGGVTETMTFMTLWWPVFGAQGVLKLATALVSIATAVVIWQILPKLLAIPSMDDLERANELLKAENLELNDEVGRSRFELNLINSKFEMALTGSNISVFSQDSDLRYTWIHNPRFGFGSKDVLGKTDAEILPAETTEEIVPLKRAVMETGESASTYIAIDDQEVGTIFLDLIVHPTRDAAGEIDGVLCTAVDMTEKNLYEIRLASMASQLAEANKRFETALEGSLITVFEQDMDLKYVHIVNPPPGYAQENFIGMTDADLISDEDQLKILPAKKKVLETGESEVIEFDVELGGKTRNYNLRLDPARDRTGRVSGVIGTAVDLTHKRENERQMHLVMRELTHRSKNLLAVIQAMARQTAARSDTTDDFVESFSARLQAMAASHDLLVSQSWYGADLRELILAQLSQSIAPNSPQITLKGISCTITAEAAQNLGLALHELTTNAAKYGALSVVDGRLSVSWERSGDKILLNWKESGGPEVAEPKRNGFGRILLERLVGPSLDGNVKIEFSPEGVNCAIEIPTKHIAS
ncbi:sensor histidine kinase [Roseibium marinum]|uniref:Blue-light-activated histidine kinase n=1 Tax=Roseibium marinum TaxID=281252 RepID=A0A2S3ULJ1_9HYPH|nr:HWE histidine kinase domain-containing protein [Roseibium marinum]POF28423.1 PAS domain S-box-containing protein [Roseibium marinum]